jgi:hypothetical protein
MSSENYEECGYWHDLDLLIISCANCMFHILLQRKKYLSKLHTLASPQLYSIISPIGLNLRRGWSILLFGASNYTFFSKWSARYEQ